MIGVALVGAGRMGHVRARVMAETDGAKLVSVSDQRAEAAGELADTYGAKQEKNWRDAISSPEVEVVVVATPTLFHREIACAALSNGKHVLCEKPLARNVEEALQIVQQARSSGKLLKTGFNYRHLPHVRKAKELIDSGAIGRPMFIRCHFGHGGRPGFDKEWHTDPRLSGGGVLQEQGIHLMDLIRHLLGEPSRVMAHRDVFYWTLSEIEDNCFCLFETREQQIAQIHVSWTQWRNSFHMEIFGKDGYIKLQGRDGHYGSPVITWAKRNADHSRPHEESIEFQQGEDWRQEWKEFLSAIYQNRQPAGSGLDGLYAQLMIEKAYESATSGKWLDFEPAWSACSKI